MFRKQRSTENPIPNLSSKHADMMKGGELVLTMGDKPSVSWGTMKEDFPH
jgi:putative alpha-1,2-mannosidase